MTDDDEKKLAVPIYAPDEQTKLPGFKKYIPAPPKDWRKWEDGRGNKVDAPAYRGQQFTGKIIPPLTDSHGNAIRDGALQLVQDAKGVYRVIDWSQPAAGDAVRQIDDGEEREGRTLPIMGRCIYETRHSLDRAKLALSILGRKKKECDAGLPDDPVQCKDLTGKSIFVGKLVLARYARGRFAGCYAIVNTREDIAAPGYRLVMKKGITLKEAVTLLVKESKRPRKPGMAVAVVRKKYVAVGSPISFSPPEGFGGFGGAQDREGVAPDSLPWDTTVELFARTGKWCKTAMLIWAGNYPEELVEQCQNYREEFLEDPSKFYDVFTEVRDDDLREIAESHEIVRDVLEKFEGSFVMDFIPSDPGKQKKTLP